MSWFLFLTETSIFNLIAVLALHNKQENFRLQFGCSSLKGLPLLWVSTVLTVRFSFITPRIATTQTATIRLRWKYVCNFFPASVA